MTREPITVRPDTLFLDAANLLVAKGFSGFPVVDTKGRVAGILTEYDLIIKGSSFHLPTFIKLLQEIELYKKDAKSIGEELKRLTGLTVKDVMNPEPFTVLDTVSIDDIAKAFSEHHKINPIIVVDAQGKLVGVVSRRDLIKLFGNSSVLYSDEHALRPLDVSMNKFVGGFTRKFVVISRFRTQTWLFFSFVFFLIGFIIAFALIVRINLPE